MVFPFFKSEFGNKELMIWATVSSQSFCLLTVWRFSIFNFQEYNHSDFGIDHLVTSMCRVFSCDVGRGYLLWPVCSFGKTLLAFTLLHFGLQGQAKFACYSGYLLTSYFCIPVPYNEKGHLFWVLVPKGLVGLHRTVQLQLLQHYWLGNYETMNYAM